jgi:phosphate transport system protein
MREQFHEQLQQVTTDLAGMCAQAAHALRQATTALLTPDLDAAQQVLEAETKLGHAREGSENQAMTLLARQAPVATDLRLIVTAVRCGEKIARMGELAGHIANIALRTYPSPAVPAELEHYFTDMGRRAATMADQIQDIFTHASGTHFDELDHTDESVDELHRSLMRQLTNNTSYDTPTATNVALLARFYERFADQAVSIAQHLDFATTGTLPINPR